jgi:ABC-2 type transport system ATP-binding protein
VLPAVPAKDHAEHEAKSGVALAHAGRNAEYQDPEERACCETADDHAHHGVCVTVDGGRGQESNEHETGSRVHELRRDLVKPVVDHDHADRYKTHDEVGRKDSGPANPPTDKRTYRDEQNLRDGLMRRDGLPTRTALPAADGEGHDRQALDDPERGGAVVAAKREAERFGGVEQRRTGHDHGRQGRRCEASKGSSSDTPGGRHGRRPYPLGLCGRRHEVRHCGHNLTAGSVKMEAMNSSTTLSIEATGLRKAFGETVAVDNLSIECVPGQVTALLGPNGAGKSTFVRMVATLTRPDSGSLRVCGVDAVASPREVRRLIGLAGQSAAVEPALTGRENLVMVAKLFGHPASVAKSAADSVLAEVGLTDDGGRLVREYSGGMRRRLDLAASLVGAPRVLLLDEPTTGLDPRTRLELWDSVRSLVANGTDVLLTTQYLEEADRLADRVVIIDHGRVIATGSPSELKSQAGRDVVVVTLARVDDLGAAEPILRAAGTDEPRFDPIARALTVAVDSGPDALSHVLAALSAAHIGIDDITLRRPTLDEVFLTLTGAPQ